MTEFSVCSEAHEEFVDITDKVRGAVEKSGVRDGICLVVSPHTTAAITVNEGTDPAVAIDLVAGLERLVPAVPWRHAEGNSPAHLKTSLVGSSCALGIQRGELVLGTWQRVFLCEFDGPRERKVRVFLVS